MLKSDEELRKSFKIELQGDDLVFIEFYDAEPEEDNNGRQAEIVVEAIDQIVSKDLTKNFSFLVDLTKTDTVTYISPKARKAYESLASNSHLNKAAVVGRSLIMEVTVNLMMQATGRGQNFKWFDNKEEALAWIKT